jgi:hypothetical protein
MVARFRRSMSTASATTTENMPAAMANANPATARF